MFVPVTSRVGMGVVFDYSNLVPGTDPGAAGLDPNAATVTLTQNPDVVQNLNMQSLLSSVLPVAADGGYLVPGAASTSTALNPMWLIAALAGFALFVSIGGRKR